MKLLPVQTEGEASVLSGWRNLFRRHPEPHEKIIRWASLLWSGFFFVQPYHAHTLRQWGQFSFFYVVFLGLYFGIGWSSRRNTTLVLLALLFLLGFAYFPFNHGAGGLFVYPSVMLPFVLQEPRARAALRIFAILLIAQIAAVFLEIFLVHLSLSWAESIAFYIVVLGLSNFAFSRQIIATQQLQRANQEIQHLAQAAERERIARDLHDLLGHTLTVIAIRADLANRVFLRDPAMAQREIAGVEQTARKALDEVRRAVSGYRAEGLAAEIAAARSVLAVAGVQFTTDLHIPVLAPDALQVLCLALREGVTNVIRHAHATACVLCVFCDASEGTVRMVLRDNGVGPTRSDGNGLRGMRERVDDVGGHLAFCALPEGGSQLTLCVPHRQGQDSFVSARNSPALVRT